MKQIKINQKTHRPPKSNHKKNCRCRLISGYRFSKKKQHKTKRWILGVPGFDVTHTTFPRPACYCRFYRADFPPTPHPLPTPPLLSFFLLASCGRADGKFWCHQPWHSGTEAHAEPRGAAIGAHVFVPRRWWNRWCGAARLCCTCVPACWLISLVMWNVTICSPPKSHSPLLVWMPITGRKIVI